MVQVIRDEYVTNVPVRVLGDTGTERVQIAGALRIRFADRVVVGSAPAGNAGSVWRAMAGPTPASRTLQAGEAASRLAGLRRPRCSRPAARARNAGSDQPLLARSIPTNKSFQHANVSETMRPGRQTP